MSATGQGQMSALDADAVGLVGRDAGDWSGVVTGVQASVQPGQTGCHRYRAAGYDATAYRNLAAAAGIAGLPGRRRPWRYRMRKTSTVCEVSPSVCGASAW
jgi:hypothetical protein